MEKDIEYDIVEMFELNGCSVLVLNYNGTFEATVETFGREQKIGVFHSQSNALEYAYSICNNWEKGGEML